MVDIPGDYLEGGGQILRTATAFSCISRRPIRVFNIRAKRSNPGLRPQHLFAIGTLAKLFKAETRGLEAGSREIAFVPTAAEIQEHSVDVDIQTAGSIGLILQPLLIAAAFKGSGICFNIKGGTSGLGAVPVDYYPNVIFPILSRSGLKARLEVIKRGYYPKGGGQVKVVVEQARPKGRINLVEPGKLIRIEGISIASSELSSRQVAERQAEKAGEVLKGEYSVPVKIKAEYASILSPGSEINLYAYTGEGGILGSDARGERGKSAEKVGLEAAGKLIKEIESDAAADFHLADNLVPWLSLLGGSIKTSAVSLHTQTNIWVAELFFGKVFKIEGNKITCERCLEESV
ncbi:MAG: RNA 3'-terminal phosphate cyclase [Candidatus Omnitrophota bacterium]